MSSLASPGSASRARPPRRRSEWLWVLCVSGLVLFLSTIPYLVAYGAQTAQYVFNGSVFDRQDYAVHLATMQLGARGSWTYHFLFTHEPHTGAYVKLGYIALGHLAALLGINLPITYQVARVFFGFSACMAIYLFFVMTFKEIYWRRIGFLLAILGSGLGWMQLLLGWLPQSDISPIDYWMVDGYVFFSILTFPHFAAVMTLIIGMVVAFLAYLERKSIWWLVGIMVLGVCAQTIQPFSPIIGDIAIFGAWCGSAWQKRKLRWQDIGILAAIALSQVPLFIYNSQVFKSGAIWEAFVAQNITLSPPPVYYLWGYLLFWPFVVIGIAHLLMKLKAGNPENLVDNLPGLAAGFFWVIGVLVLAYLPTVLQRRFMLGYTVPLSILTVYALKNSIFPWLERRRVGWINHIKGFVPVILIAFSMISSLLLIANTAWAASQHSQALFDPGELIDAVDWLGAHAGQGDVVLSSEATGLLVAARTGLPVYLGHPIETMDYQNKSELVRDFFQGKIEPGVMYQRGVRWVIWGRAEKELTDSSRLGRGLNNVYQNQDVVIYEITP
jgi:hypothetical protein